MPGGPLCGVESRRLVAKRCAVGPRRFAAKLYVEVCLRRGGAFCCAGVLRSRVESALLRRHAFPKRAKS